jgi:hypothetical protein
MLSKVAKQKGREAGVSKSVVKRPLTLLVAGVLLAGLSAGYIMTAPFGLPHNIWILEAIFLLGVLATVGGLLWLVGLGVRRNFRA